MQNTNSSIPVKSISICGDMHKQLKFKAVEENCTVRQLAEKFIKVGMEKRKKQQK